MSYQVSTEQAVTNAGRMVKEGGVDAVKLEGGAEYAEVIKAIVRAGIPVMGHVGMTPQSAASSTGYRLRGKSAEDAERVIRDAEEVAKAGAFSIVLEFTTAEVAEYLSQTLEIPVIGVGAGPHCDGQFWSSTTSSDSTRTRLPLRRSTRTLGRSSSTRSAVTSPMSRKVPSPTRGGTGGWRSARGWS